MAVDGYPLLGSDDGHAQEEQEFVVTEGDFHVLKQKGKTGTVELDYDQAKMGNLHTMDITVRRSSSTWRRKIPRHSATGKNSWRNLGKCSPSAGTRRKADTSNS